MTQPKAMGRSPNHQWSLISFPLFLLLSTPTHYGHGHYHAQKRAHTRTIPTTNQQMDFTTRPLVSSTSISPPPWTGRAHPSSSMRKSFPPSSYRNRDPKCHRSSPKIHLSNLSLSRSTSYIPVSLKLNEPETISKPSFEHWKSSTWIFAETSLKIVHRHTNSMALTASSDSKQFERYAFSKFYTLFNYYRFSNEFSIDSRRNTMALFLKKTTDDHEQFSFRSLKPFWIIWEDIDFWSSKILFFLHLL